MAVRLKRISSSPSKKTGSQQNFLPSIVDRRIDFGRDAIFPNQEMTGLKVVVRASGCSVVWRLAAWLSCCAVLFFAKFQSSAFTKQIQKSCAWRQACFRSCRRLCATNWERPGCTIPQIWGEAGAHNAIRNRFLRKGEVDWRHCVLSNVSLRQFSF